MSSRCMVVMLWIMSTLSGPEASNSTMDESSDQEFLLGGRRNERYEAWLKTIDVGGPLERFFRPNNSVGVGQNYQSQSFLGGLQALQDIVDSAYRESKRVRAFGSRFASSNAAYCDEWMIDTAGLNFIRVGIDNENELVPAYQSMKSNLVFTQSGVRVKRVSEALFRSGLALSTMPATDGMRIGGVVSTGAHGSAVGFGSVQEFVKAVHLVLPGRHVLIQKASDRVVTGAFANWLGGAELIENDDLFNAAVVSFGSFGVIHGLLIQAEPLYKLRFQSKQVSFESFRDVMSTFDVSKLGFDGVNDLPYHFEMSINPYVRKKQNKGIFTRVFQKIPLSQQEIASLQNHNLRGADAKLSENDVDIYDALGEEFFPTSARLLANVGDNRISAFFRRNLYGRGLQVPLALFFRTRNGGPEIKYPFEFFTSFNAEAESFTSPIAGKGCELGVPQSRIQEALDIIFAVIDADPIAASVSVRFVKKSNATLAFTKHGDITATIEFPAPYGRIFFRETGRIHEKLFKAFQDSNFPHTYHWGQGLPENGNWVSKGFGEALSNWKAQRASLLDSVGQYIFSNEMITTLRIYDAL